MPNPVMVNRRLKFAEGDIVLGHKLWCPGCDSLHMPRSRLPETAPGHAGPLWEWDENTEAPTFDPSYLAHVDGREGIKKCHSFIRAGQWEFLGDCYHRLAGRTIPLTPLPDWVCSGR